MRGSFVGISQAPLGSEQESVRLDIFLKRSRIITRRTLARQVCDHGGIWVNGHQAKGSRLVKAGDLIQWRQVGKITTLKVSRIPSVSLGKKEARSLYEIISREFASAGEWVASTRTDSS